MFFCGGGVGICRACRIEIVSFTTNLDIPFKASVQNHFLPVTSLLPGCVPHRVSPSTPDIAWRPLAMSVTGVHVQDPPSGLGAMLSLAAGLLPRSCRGSLAAAPGGCQLLCQGFPQAFRGGGGRGEGGCVL